MRFDFNLSNVIVVLVIAAGVWFFRDNIFNKVEIKDRIVTVDLTRRQIDSLELAFEKRFKGKRQIVTRTNTVVDTALVTHYRQQYEWIKDSLLALQQRDLFTYKNDSLNQWGDSLLVEVDCLSDSGYVKFSPGPGGRSVTTTIKDTTRIGDPLWLDVLQVAAGAGIGYAIKGIQGN